jgi:hypothetical protein
VGFFAAIHVNINTNLLQDEEGVSRHHTLQSQITTRNIR